jgi:hypothetical protein
LTALALDTSVAIPLLVTAHRGGAVYDALVALAAVERSAGLATRDVRAKATYEIVGARVVVAG